LHNFSRWLRLTGVECLPVENQIDWLIESCNPKTRKVVSDLAKTHIGDLKKILLEMSKLYPQIENDITIRTKIDNLPVLPASPEPQQIAHLLLELENLFAQMSPAAITDQDKFLILIKRLNGKFSRNSGQIATSEIKWWTTNP